MTLNHDKGTYYDYVMIYISGHHLKMNNSISDLLASFNIHIKQNQAIERDEIKSNIMN